jgi:hypothetical protein
MMTFKTLTIAAALGLAATTASAQTNGWLGGAAAYAGDDYRAPYQDGRRVAYDNGYRDGVKRGEDAARAGRQFNVEVERAYRSADDGYTSAYGDRSRYRDDYRGGFAQGYRDGYNRLGTSGNYGYGTSRNNGAPVYGNNGYPVYGNNGPVYGNNGTVRGNNGYGGNYGYGPSTSYGAFQNGAADGYKKGLEDVQNRRAPDVTRQKWYRGGDHNYDSAYGSKDAYKVDYRRGFEQGYSQAYNGARRY